MSERAPRRRLVIAVSAAATVLLIAVGVATWFHRMNAPRPIADGGAVNAVTIDGGRVAIGGYDTVAYFTDGRAVAGKPEFAVDWNGASWRFTDQSHADMFAAAPESYAPQYGGYCAVGIAGGELWAVDPEAWQIVDGKLYLNFSTSIQEEFKSDPAAIARADEAWASRKNLN